MKTPLVSIIMATYNAAQYIADAIDSVLSQSYSNWELIIVNDGSTDHTDSIVQKYTDNRIKYIQSKKNKGVSHARNLAISRMRGSFICFLDSDDVLPVNSIVSRIEIFFKKPDVSFVDGCVEYVNEDLVLLHKKKYVPDFRGIPLDLLLTLDRRCVFGNTWMIKVENNTVYKFDHDMTHSEDLFFYISIAESRLYDFTTQTVLLYRNRANSAMKNTHGLQRGYKILLEKLKRKFPSKSLMTLKKRIIRIMFLTWLIEEKNPYRAVVAIIKFLRY
ncbi:MAG: glycosyltransferase [Cyclobacteriaceae bacterium]